jgi:hypothetical protein
MNKQELIEKYKAQLKDCTPFGRLVSHDLIVSHFLDDLKQLDEPKKPVVPQFVADWYEENKDDFEGNLFRCINTISSMYEDEELNDFENWVIEAHTEPFQTLVNMHQFGYTVEIEKRYYVRFKFIEDSYSYLTLIKHLNAWTLTNIKLDKKFRSEHTKKQLEGAGFGWVFDCPGIEIEEAE